MMFSRQSFVSSTYKKIIIRTSACMENMSASSNYICLRSLTQESKYGQILLILVDTHTHTHTYTHTHIHIHSYIHTYTLIDTLTHHIVTHAHTITYILFLSLSLTHTHSRQKTCIKNKILRTLTGWQVCANQGKTNNLPCSIRTLGFIPRNMLPTKS